MRFVAENATLCALSTREIERASAVDKELSSIRECIQKGWWETQENKWYFMVRSELSVIGKPVLRGPRIIVPSSLRERVLNLTHEGTKVWWPNCDKDAERFCTSCLPCQMVSMSPPPEPLKRTELPSGPWQHISAGLMTFITTFRRPPVCGRRLLQLIYGSTSSEVYYNRQDYQEPQEHVSYPWSASEYHYR